MNMDVVDMDMVDMDMVDQCNATFPTGHCSPRKQSIAMVHYWVRHAECTWSSCVLLSSKGGLLDQISKNAGAAPGETDN